LSAHAERILASVVHLHNGPEHASKYTCVKAKQATCVQRSERGRVQHLQHATDSADGHLACLLYARAAERDTHMCKSTIADTPPRYSSPTWAGSAAVHHDVARAAVPCNQMRTQAALCSAATSAAATCGLLQAALIHAGHSRGAKVVRYQHAESAQVRSRQLTQPPRMRFGPGHA
jgi:hypothetical protein